MDPGTHAISVIRILLFCCVFCYFLVIILVQSANLYKRSTLSSYVVSIEEW
jgi:IS4 transposase